MYLRKKRILVGIIACAAALSLSGCMKSAEHYRKVETGAVRYYKKKYGDRVTVEKSIIVGDSGLFGYLGLKDRAYTLSDGVQVFWNDDEEYYADNRQAEEISAALREEIMPPAIAELGPEAVISEYSFNRRNTETFDECVFTEYYSGDIREYAKAEIIRLTDFSAAITAENFKTKTECFERTLEPYLRGGSASVGVMAEDYEGDPSLDICGFSGGNPDARAFGKITFGEGIRWLENVYIEAAPGVRVTSGVYDLVLEPGDVIFEEAGTGQDLQEKIDDGFYALPVAAEENKKSGYSVRDQAHERRPILQDLDSPVYRVRFSERVQGQRDSNGKVGLYFLTERPEGGYIWYYTNDSRYAYTIFRLAEPGRSKGNYAYLTGEETVYFGNVEFGW